MNSIHQKIINAIIQKSQTVCPGALALIGIYGSVATKDLHEKSDLDLLILIQNEDGYKLATGFILSDSEIGYDIYCMDWARMQNDADCHSAYLARLMDSEIVYVKDQSALDLLYRLREETKRFLASPLRFERVAACIDRAKICYANACLQSDLGKVRCEVFGVITYLSDAAMLYHGCYFKRGTKRMLEELAALPIENSFLDTIKAIAQAQSQEELRTLTRCLLQYAEKAFIPQNTPKTPSEALAGTYEEMFSNWRNKVAEAEKNGDTLSSFMNLCSLQLMLDDIAHDTEIGHYDLMGNYDPHNLSHNTKLYDACLSDYETIYQKAHLQVKRYPNVDAFVEDYLTQRKQQRTSTP